MQRPRLRKAHRARGLCSTHYNQQHATPEQRHRKVTIPCAWCSAPCIKESSQDRKYRARFCSLACRDAKRAHEAIARSLPVGPVALTWRPIPKSHPARAVIPTPRVWVAGDCAECGSAFVTSQPGTRYCARKCSKRAHRRARKELRGYIVPARVRAHVYERDNWTCWLCQQPIDRDAKAPHPLSHSVDHILPQSRGGRHEPYNLRTAHFRCNAMRRDRCGAVLLALIEGTSHSATKS